MDVQIPYSPLTVDHTLPVPDMKPSLVKLCKDLFKEWSDLDESRFFAERVAGGITNLLLKVSVKEQNGITVHVTVRLYGPNTEYVINRERELQAIQYLSAAGFGAKLLGVFGNGMVQSFIHARTLEPIDLRKPKLAAEIAKQLKRFHQVEIPGSKEPQLWTDIFKFFERASTLTFDDLERQKRYETISFKEVHTELIELKDLTGRLDAPVVFAHNDLLSGNLMLNDASRLFESFVVVGLHPNCDIQALQRQYFGRRSELPGRLRTALSVQNQFRVEPNLEPQVLFVYPPDKQLPLRSKDLLSFCFPGGLEVHTIERTPSMSELNEILLGQEHLKQNDLSFVFRLQGADDSILYGCCVLVDELVQQPSRLISMMGDQQLSSPPMSRHILTTRRCYCILTRLPFFELHFGVLNSIFIEERLERLTKSISDLDVELVYDIEVYSEDKVSGVSAEYGSQELLNGTTETVQLIRSNSITERAGDCVTPVRPEIEIDSSKKECESPPVDAMVSNKHNTQKQIPNAILPLLRYQQYDSSDSSSSFQGSPSEDRSFRSDVDSPETEEASSSGQEDNEHNEILNWAKTSNHGSLQIICEYNRLCVPTRGSTIKFHPLDHLHPLEFHRPDETVLHIAGSKVDLMSCSTSFELAEAHKALAVEEEATALSIWAISSICGSLRLEHILTIFAGALLEKQIVFVCSNLGILSASVLSIIPLIRPYQWQSFFMPVLPNDMLDFLDAPVPFIVGVKSKTAEVQSKSGNVILVDANKNQVKSLSIPHFPRYKELYAALTPYHAQLVGESYLGKRRPVYDCTDVQVEAAKGFLRVLRSYLDSLCSNLRSHTITNVQSNDDKVSLLLKESFIESFPSRDRPFMKLFVDTQLFSAHTDLVLSLFQKD